jgi:hypothetical protein
VRSWQQGGFNFTLDSGNNTDTLKTLLQDFTGSPLQPGMSTLPICAPAITYVDNDYESSGWAKENWLAPFPDAKTDAAALTRVRRYDLDAMPKHLWVQTIEWSSKFKRSFG